MLMKLEINFDKLIQSLRLYYRWINCGYKVPTGSAKYENINKFLELEMSWTVVNKMSKAMKIHHYCDVIMCAMAFQITSLTIVYSIVHSGADQRKHQSSASLAFVQGIHPRSVNSLHKWPVTRKMFPLDNVIMADFEKWHIEKLRVGTRNSHCKVFLISSVIGVQEGINIDCEWLIWTPNDLHDQSGWNLKIVCPHFLRYWECWMSRS